MGEGVSLGEGVGGKGRYDESGAEDDENPVCLDTIMEQIKC